MIALREVTVRRGGRPVLRGVDLTVHAGWKVGITGANGAGKSSLLALVRGEIEADEGSVELPRQLVLAHVDQEQAPSPRPAVEEVVDGDGELRAVESRLAAAEADGDGVQLGALHARLEAIGGYAARARAARLLAGLGFTAVEAERPLDSFSGGWRMRVALARALMCRSDVLLLDEPTNHLDLDAVIWLEGWLRAYRGTLALISHDREFLDRVVDHVAHLQGGEVRLYAGNYSAFERQRAERLARERAMAARQEREIAHMRAFVERFRAKATKARQAQSRLKALSRMEVIVTAHVDSPFRFSFREPGRLPNPLVTMRDARVGYAPSTPVLDGLGLRLEPGDRVGLLGRNGAGKSTLVKLLAGELEPLGGEVAHAPGLEVGYFAQHQLEQLDAHASPLEHLARLDRETPEQRLRDFLGGFGFGGVRADDPVERLSGGQRARLALALVLHRAPGLLLLDEPTNHLDLEMRQALTVALQGFAGALVLVSHDRHLLGAVTDALWLVADGTVGPYEGDLDDYARWLLERVDGSDRDATPPARASARARRQREAEIRRALGPLRAEVQGLEAALDALGARRAAVESRLADGGLYRDAAGDVEALLAEQGDLARRVHETEVAWLAACERLESAEVAAREA